MRRRSFLFFLSSCASCGGFGIRILRAATDNILQRPRNEDPATLKVLLVSLGADETYLRRRTTMVRSVVSFGHKALELEGVGLELGVLIIGC